MAEKNNSKNRRHEIQCQSEKILLLDFFISLEKLSYNRLSMIGLELRKIEKKCTPNEKNELKNGLNLYLYSPD